MKDILASVSFLPEACLVGCRAGQGIRSVRACHAWQGRKMPPRCIVYYEEACR
jgi:hypothetical protein